MFLLPKETINIRNQERLALALVSHALITLIDQAIPHQDPRDQVRLQDLTLLLAQHQVEARLHTEVVLQGVLLRVAVLRQAEVHHQVGVLLLVEDHQGEDANRKKKHYEKYLTIIHS